MIKSFVIIISLLITSNAFAGGANLFELKKEAKAKEAARNKRREEIRLIDQKKEQERTLNSLKEETNEII